MRSIGSLQLKPFSARALRFLEEYFFSPLDHCLLFGRRLRRRAHGGRAKQPIFEQRRPLPRRTRMVCRGAAPSARTQVHLDHCKSSVFPRGGANNPTI
jgi:hypothetical protein